VWRGDQVAFIMTAKLLARSSRPHEHMCETRDAGHWRREILPCSRCRDVSVVFGGIIELNAFPSTCTRRPLR